MDLLPTGDLSGWESNMGLLLLFIGLILVTLFGRNIVRLIYPDAARVESLALGYLIGLGLFTLALFRTNLAGLKYAALESNSLLVVLFIISAYLARNTRPTPLVKRSGKITTIITILFGIFFLVPVLLYGLYWPAKDWDSMTIEQSHLSTLVLWMRDLERDMILAIHYLPLLVTPGYTQ